MSTTQKKRTPRKTTLKAETIKAKLKAAIVVAKKEAEMTPEQKRYAGLMTAHVLMGAYNHDHERGGGMLLHALKHLDTDIYSMFYKQVQTAVADKLKELEAPYENQAARKPRARRANPIQRKDARGHRAAGHSQGKAPARKSAGSRTRKSAG